MHVNTLIESGIAAEDIAVIAPYNLQVGFSAASSFFNSSYSYYYHSPVRAIRVSDFREKRHLLYNYWKAVVLYVCEGSENSCLLA